MKQKQRVGELHEPDKRRFGWTVMGGTVADKG